MYENWRESIPDPICVGCELYSDEEHKELTWSGMAWDSFKYYSYSDAKDTVSWTRVLVDLFVATKSDGDLVYVDHPNYTLNRRVKACDILLDTEEKWMKEFAWRLKYLMANSYLSQTDLANKLGCSQGSISYYLKEKRVPSSYILMKMAEVFNCPIEFIMCK